VWTDGRQGSFSPDYGDSAFNRWNNLCTEEIVGAIGCMTYYGDSAFNRQNNLYTEEIIEAVGRMTGAAGCRTANARQRVA
jgi:hypothetical protein